MRIWLYLALGLAAGASELGVVYTGRLIGYARACAEERFRRDKIVDGVQYYDRVCVSATGGYGGFYCFALNAIPPREGTGR